MSRPKMHPVTSSNIASIGFNPYPPLGKEPSGTLWVKFCSGSAYYYTDVPARIFKAFKNAPSKGKYFYSKIKGNSNYKGKYDFYGS